MAKQKETTKQKERQEIKYVSIKEAANALAITPQELQELCEKKEIPGAKRNKRSWQIPNSSLPDLEKKLKIKKILANIRKSTKNIFKGIGIIGIVSLFYASISFLADLGPAKTAAAQLGFDFIPRAKNDEMLIIIASIYVPEGTKRNEPEIKIKKMIDENLIGIDFTNKVRVAISEKEFERNFSDINDVKEYAASNNASIIIWGDETNLEVNIRFMNLRGECCSIDYDELNENERTQSADDDKEYETFLYSEMPEYLTFLSMYTIGQMYIVDGDDEKALESLKRGLTSLPGEYYHTDLALGYILEDDLNDKEEFEAMIKSMTESDPSVDFSGITQTFFQIAILEDRDTKNDVIKYLEIASVYSPDNYKILKEIGWQHYLNGEYDLAVESYSSALKVHHDASIYEARADAYQSKEDWASAYEDIVEAIKLDNKNADYYAYASECLVEMDKQNEALDYIQQAIDLDSTNVWYYIDQSNILTSLQRYEEAIESCKKGIEKNPDNSMDLLYNRAMAYWHNKDWQNAVDDFDSYEEKAMAVSFYYFYYFRADAKYQINDLDGALEDVNMDISMHSDSPAAYNLRSLIYEGRGEFELAEDDRGKYEELMSER